MRSKKTSALTVFLRWLCVAAVIVGGCLSLSPGHHLKSAKTSVHVNPERLREKTEEKPPAIPEEKPQLPMPSMPAGEEALPEVPNIATAHIKAPLVVLGKKPEIAIVIDDVGIDLKGSKKAIGLPSPITLSFLPYAPHLREQAHDARDRGHEMLLHMPMEPMGRDNPGPGALLVDLPADEIRQRFETALASFVGFDGVNNHMGSKFTADQKGMEIVIDELQQRHLFYLDSRTSPKTVGETIAHTHGLPTIARDVFLDDDENIDAIQKQLEVTEHLAKKRGYVVAIGHPHASTMQALEAWIPEAEERGFVFIPIHQLLGNAFTKP